MIRQYDALPLKESRGPSNGYTCRLDVFEEGIQTMIGRLEKAFCQVGPINVGDVHLCVGRAAISPLKVRRFFEMANGLATSGIELAVNVRPKRRQRSESCFFAQQEVSETWQAAHVHCHRRHFVAPSAPGWLTVKERRSLGRVGDCTSLRTEPR